MTTAPTFSKVERTRLAHTWCTSIDDLFRSSNEVYELIFSRRNTVIEIFEERVGSANSAETNKTDINGDTADKKSPNPAKKKTGSDNNYEEFGTCSLRPPKKNEDVTKLLQRDKKLYFIFRNMAVGIMQTLSKAIRQLDDLAAMQPRLYQLGQKHIHHVASHRLTTEQFTEVEGAVIEAMRSNVQKRGGNESDVALWHTLVEFVVQSIRTGYEDKVKEDEAKEIEGSRKQSSAVCAIM